MTTVERDIYCIAMKTAMRGRVRDEGPGAETSDDDVMS